MSQQKHYYKLDESQLKKAKDLFSLFDKNNNNQIEVKELGKVFNQLNNSNISESELKNYLKDADLDDNGVLNFEEFVKVIAPHLKPNEKEIDEIKKAFKQFDVDNDGFITKEEMKRAFGILGEDDSHIDEILNRADTNSDGKVSFDEFLTLSKNQ